MRRWIKIAILSLLLAGGAVLCVIRWQAWFGMPDEPQWTGRRYNYTFPTFVMDSVPGFVQTPQGWQDTVSPQSLDILVLGDIHTNLKQADYDSLAARVPQADIVLQAGDWLHRGQEYYRQMLLREWLPSGLCGLPVINSPGNHEYSKGLHKELSPIWSETFPYPANGPVGVPGAHFYVDMPSMRIISIDTNPLVHLVYLTRTLTWLRQAMNTAGSRYIVVVMHHPVFSVAKGRFNSHIYATFRYALGQADLVIAGHDHNYMRRTPFIEINTAGKTKSQRYHFRTDVTDSAHVYGVLSVERPDAGGSPSPMIFRVYRMEDGAMIDSLYVKHD
jgi:predicted phosphodiesterase